MPGRLGMLDAMPCTDELRASDPASYPGWTEATPKPSLMTRTELDDLIAQGEGPAVEFKRSLARDLGREICAFANADGGTLLLGVAGSGEVVGVGNHNRTRARVLSTARSASPSIMVVVDSIGEVLRVVVPPQKDKPYSFGWRSFMRDGANSRRMSNAEVENLFYAVGRAHFDKKPCPSFSLEDDVDSASWQGFVRRAKMPRGMDRILVLRNLGLVDAEDRMTNAGAWLLGPDIRRFSDSGFVSCILFEGTDEDTVLDEQDFHGPLPTMIDEVAAWIQTHINIQLTIWQEGREERPELPEEAVLEAVVNAVAHRDYRSTSSVQVRVFRDRVEIASPGGLPEGMPEADLGTHSVPSNPLLYGVLSRMDLVGKSGSGIRRMGDSCRDYGLMPPRVKVSDGGFMMVFERPVMSPQPTLEPDRTIQDDHTGIIQDGVSPLELGDKRLRRAYRTRWDSSRSDRPGARRQASGDRSELPVSYRYNTGSAGESYRSDTGHEPDSAPDRPSTMQVSTMQVRQLVMALDGDRSRAEIIHRLGLRNRSNVANNYLRPALEAGFIEMTIPEKPTSSKQRYRLTPMGRELRAELEAATS